MMSESSPSRPAAHGYATVTVMSFTDSRARNAGLAALKDLIEQAADVPGLRDVLLLGAGDADAVMVTVYASQDDAELASAPLRPHVGQAVGRHMAGPPRRWAGDVLVRRAS